MSNKTHAVPPRIALRVTEEDSREWLVVSKEIRGKGIYLKEIVGRFLLDKLAEAKKNGYKELKKYI